MLLGMLGMLEWSGGCAANRREVQVDFSPTVRHLRADDYPEVLQRWTRHTKVVADVGTVIEVWAVLKSAEFREAYIERYAAVYHLSEPDRDQLHDVQVQQVGAVYEFHVTAQSTEWKWNDFDKRETAWRVTLVDGAGNSIAPLSVQAQRLPEPYEESFFPNRTPFTRTYVIKFEKEVEDRPFAGPASGRLALRFSSPVGEAELMWRAQ